jgi:hypothetical protein
LEGELNGAVSTRLEQRHRERKKDFILYPATPYLTIPPTTYQTPNNPINKAMTSPPPP